uniref:Uncharacterized protein n=1 Tax=Oryza sativa subsp. japonica TaxID=39947 RepID=Q6ZJ54_ORYSJ|nr:hypothetical protein [Oryza sativa Japonica Group]BAD33110.1 hypothetical protein [Oryza sativa Japonica Group]
MTFMPELSDDIGWSQLKPKDSQLLYLASQESTGSRKRNSSKDPKAAAASESSGDGSRSR